MSQPSTPVIWLSTRPPSARVLAAFEAIGRPLLLDQAKPEAPTTVEALRLGAAWAADRARVDPADHPVVWLIEGDARTDPRAAEAGPSPAALLRAAAVARAAAEDRFRRVILDRQARAFRSNRMSTWRLDLNTLETERITIQSDFAAGGDLPDEPGVPDEPGMPKRIATVHPDDRPAVRRMLQQLKPDSQLVLRARLRTADGAWAASEIRGRWAPDPRPGHPGSVSGVTIDMRLWQQVEDERRRVERRWERASTMTPGFVWETDQHGVFTYLSDRVEGLLGYAPAELVGTPARDLFVAPEGALRAMAAPAPQVQTRATVALRTKDGRQLRAMTAVRVEQLGPSEGQAFHGAAVVSTGALAELDRLEAARDRAMTEATATRDFIANLSHEIRTPLTGVVGLSDILLHDAVNPKQMEQLRTLRSQADRLLETVNDVLDLARIEAGARLNQPEPCAPAATAQSVLRGRSVALGDPGLLWVRVPWAGTQVIIDPLRLQQLLRHLLISARQSDPSAPLQARLSTSDEPEQLRLRLIGEGAEALCPQLLEREAPSGPMSGGAGEQASLTLSRTLIRLLNGEVQPERDGLSVRLPAPSAPDAPAPRARLQGPVLVVAPPSRDRARLCTLLDLMDLRTLVFDTVEAVNEGQLPTRFAAAIVAVPADEPPSGAAPLTRPSAQALLERLAARPQAQRGPLLRWATNPDAWPDAPRSPNIGELPWPPRHETLWAALHDEAPAAAAGTALASLNGRSALLVEDHPVNQEVLRSLLSELGLSVEIAADGKAALKALASHGFDVVLMDCHLPVLDGLTATRRLRALERRQRAPRQLVLAMTASDLTSDRRACAEAGMDGYLVKPVSKRTLRETLQAAIGAHERGRR